MGNISYLPHSRVSVPTPVNGNVPPKRLKNAQRRSREHLFPNEVAKLIAATGKHSFYSQRDRTLITVMYHHGLRVSEAVQLRWESIDFERYTLSVNRVKGGVAATHPIPGEELRMLRTLKRDWPASPYVFSTERNGPMTTSTVRKMIAKMGTLANLPFPIHPHMLRHACGYKLANDARTTRDIQSYLGHASITSTAIYTALSPTAFKGFF